MQPPTIKNLSNNNSSNNAMDDREQALYTTRSVHTNVNLGVEMFYRFLQSNKDGRLEIPEYTQIATILHKFAASNKDIDNVIKFRRDPAHELIIQQSLLDSIRLAAESFYRFLCSNKNACFTILEYNHLCAIIQKFTAANTYFLNVNQNPNINTILHAIIGFVSDHFNQLHGDHATSPFSLDAIIQFASITQKLSSAHSQVAKYDIKEKEPISKESSNNNLSNAHATPKPNPNPSGHKIIHSNAIDSTKRHSQSQSHPKPQSHPQPKRN